MTGLADLHTTVETFEVRDGCLCVGGRTLTDIAAEFDGSPFYVYDAGLIADRVRLLKETLPPSISLHYAIKANPMPDVVSAVSGLADGLDVASAGELAVALATDTKATDISFSGPGKSVRELEEAVAAGVTVNIESETELGRLVDIAKSTGQRPRIAVRVNPDFELKSSGMKMAGGPKQFGIDAERVPQLLESMKTLPVEFVGFHIFSGSQNLRPEAICESQNKALELALALSAHAPALPQVVNIGGGFGIPYFPGDQPLDLAPIAANLRALTEVADDKLPGAEIVLELGRYIVGEAGLYVCTVLDRKVSRGQVFLVTNGGLHHHLAASGNFGQVIRKNYPVIGHFRYFFEHLGEFFRQYFFAMDREELPFNRAQRSWVYRAGKNLPNTVAFGSSRDIRRPGSVLFVNRLFG